MRLIDALDEAFVGPAWHGPSLLGSLRGVKAADALWRPAPDRHCVWDLILHAAYWKYVVRRRLTGGKRGTFGRPGSNFPRLPDPPGPAAWREDLELLRGEHARLKEVVAALPPTSLERRVKGSKWTVASMVWGVALHDIYHAGQIRLLERLRKGAERV